MSHGDNRHLVFVYGTMKTGMRNHRRIMDHSTTRFLGGARTMTTTHDLQTFVTGDGYIAPALIEGNSRVYGEVYEIDDECLSILDMCEGNGYVYRREPISIVGYKPRSVFAYFYLRDVTGGLGRDKIVDQDGVLSFEDWRSAND